MWWTVGNKLQLWLILCHVWLSLTKQATFEAFIGIRDDEATSQLALFSKHLQVPNMCSQNALAINSNISINGKFDLLILVYCFCEFIYGRIVSVEGLMGPTLREIGDWDVSLAGTGRQLANGLRVQVKGCFSFSYPCHTVAVQQWGMSFSWLGSLRCCDKCMGGHWLPERHWSQNGWFLWHSYLWAKHSVLFLIHWTAESHKSWNWCMRILSLNGDLHDLTYLWEVICMEETVIKGKLICRMWKDLRLWLSICPMMIG